MLLRSTSHIYFVSLKYSLSLFFNIFCLKIINFPGSRIVSFRLLILFLFIYKIVGVERVVVGSNERLAQIEVIEVNYPCSSGRVCCLTVEMTELCDGIGRRQL